MVTKHLKLDVFDGYQPLADHAIENREEPFDAMVLVDDLDEDRQIVR